MSHELRTPLNAVIGYSEMLQEEAEDLGEEAFLPDLQKINAAGKHLLGLINDILDLSKIEAGRMSLERTRVDLLKVARESVDAAQPAAQRRGVALSLDGSPVPDIEGDRDRLGQTVDNLISNALKFTPEGCAITVRVHDTEAGVSIAVRDEGAGIPAEDLDRLFERFYRSSSASRRAVPGVGLGLSIVQTIVEAHGGTVRIDVLNEGVHSGDATMVVPAQKLYVETIRRVRRAAPRSANSSPASRCRRVKGSTAKARG